LSVGWIGLPEMHYPTFEEGWAHSLSLVKELTIREGKLYQYPVIETTYLRQSEEVLDLAAMVKNVTETTNTYELQVAIQADCQGSIRIFSDSTGEQALVLSYDTAKGTLQLDRSKTQYPLNPEFGETRESRIPVNESLKLALFVDRSTCEIFVNDGKTVLTANYYPTEKQTNLVLQSTKQNNATYYVLEK
jgi:beta-fructofuranosidase